MLGAFAAFLLLTVRGTGAAIGTTAHLQAADGLSATVDLYNGAFSVSMTTDRWLVGLPPSLHADGAWHTTGAGGTLRLVGAETSRGTDTLGAFTAATLRWAAGEGGTPMTTTFRAYPDRPAIVFSIKFPAGANGTALGTDLACVDEVVAAFPRFSADGGRAAVLGVFAPRSFWDLDMLGVGIAGLGRGGLYGGSPLALYDRASLRTLVLSPLRNFKSTVQSTATRAPGGGDGSLACGPHGRLLRLPAGWTHETVLVAGGGVIATVVEQWGALLRSPALYDKPRLPPGGGGVASAALGYMTDTGAAYWYSHAPYRDPLAAMAATHDALAAQGVHVGWWEFDSWCPLRFCRTPFQIERAALPQLRPESSFLRSALYFRQGITRAPTGPPCRRRVAFGAGTRARTCSRAWPRRAPRSAAYRSQRTPSTTRPGATTKCTTATSLCPT